MHLFEFFAILLQWQSIQYFLRFIPSFPQSWFKPPPNTVVNEDSDLVEPKEQVHASAPTTAHIADLMHAKSISAPRKRSFTVKNKSITYHLPTYCEFFSTAEVQNHKTAEQIWGRRVAAASQCEQGQKLATTPNHCMRSKCDWLRIIPASMEWTLPTDFKQFSGTLDSYQHKLDANQGESAWRLRCQELQEKVDETMSAKAANHDASGAQGANQTAEFHAKDSFEKLYDLAKSEKSSEELVHAMKELICPDVITASATS